MNIKILGTGGFFNEGLPCNALAIDGHVLVETPPDILQSLFRNGIRLEAIDTVFISHVHGDHCFGFPFFFFNWLKKDTLRKVSTSEMPPQLLLIGPQGLAERMKALMAYAISPDHSYLKEFDSRVNVIEIDEGKTISVLGGLWFSFMRTRHSLPTFSLIAGEGDIPAEPEMLRRARFIYSSDTAMHPGIARLIDSGAGLLLFDTNGEKPGDVHLCAEELATVMAEVRPLAMEGDEQELVVRGTHVSRLPPLSSHGIRFARDGEEYSV